mmetsp:Transcript_152515/g.280686  ORF Transcript_152515/g.280686 Transcript_152515/m.280686 type:complete len:1343 (-) Transcript_152515:70-4098(-)
MASASSRPAREEEQEAVDAADVNCEERSDASGGTDDRAGGSPTDLVQNESSIVLSPAPEPQPAPRLMIKQIHVENFKSYGGRKVIGPFHKCYSSIIGPNGSGKSNVIDALLFVFGKRARKMRLSRISDLIHCSGDLANCKHARVEVVFQNILDTGDGPEDYRVVQGSEFTVAREAHSNNQSKYFVNDAASTFSDVTALLQKSGVDLEHNRFLILQGEVEQISLMKPKALGPHEDGLLEYLEDIIGSNRHIEPIEQTHGLVERLSEQRQEKLDRLRKSERERESLDGPRREAEAWVNSEAERLQFDALVAQLEMQKRSDSMEKLQHQNKSLEERHQDHRRKMSVFEDQVKTIENDHNKHYKEWQSFGQLLEKAQSDFKKLEQQDAKLGEDLDFQTQKAEKCKHKAEQEKERAVQLVSDAEKIRAQTPLRDNELTEALRESQTLKQELEQVYESLKGKAEKLRPALEAKEAELVPLQSCLTEARNKMEITETEVRLLQEKTSKAVEQLEEIKRSRSECGPQLQTREENFKESIKKLNEQSALLGHAKVRMNGLVQQQENMAREVQAARVKAEEAKSSFSDARDRGHLIRGVNAQAKAGKLQGVHGRLGDLGTIDKKYDVAVSTACTMLDAIVVDTTDNAQAVIEFIRRENLGRTTCICLKEIQKRVPDMEQKIATPERLPRLVDLIKPSKPAFKVAFYSGLLNTLVAENLEQATRVGLQGTKRWRVVTLQGELIEPSGTLSGGGNRVARGGMQSSSCLYSSEEVQDIVKKFERASAKLTSIRAERNQMEEAMQTTEKEMAQEKLAVKKYEMDIASIKEQMAAYDERLKSTKVPSLSSGEKARLRELENTREAHTEQFNKAKAEHQVVEDQRRELHNKIMNVGGERLRVAKAKVEESTKRCEDMRKHNKKILLDAENMLRNSKKAESDARHAVEERAAAERIAADLQEHVKRLEEQAEQLMKSQQDLEKQRLQEDKAMKELKAKRDEVYNAANELKSREVDLVNEIEQSKLALQEVQKVVNTWKRRLQEVRAEYKQLPLDIIVGDGHGQREAEADGDGDRRSGSMELARRAVHVELAKQDLSRVVRAEVDARLLTLRANLKDQRPNLAAIEEFRRVDADFKARSSEYQAADAKREDAQRKLEELRQRRRNEFMTGFSILSMKLKEMYQMLTLGGDAELELHDTLDPFRDGIHFSVRPPKKSWKHMTNLSGGEKTLASLSLVFALHYYRPTPLYFMDEIDASLDSRNVLIISNYIKECTKNAQFIVITLRDRMFELADVLVGIYKTNDVSKSVVVVPDAFEEAEIPVMRSPVMDKDTFTPQSSGTKRPIIDGEAESTPRAVRHRES